MNEQQFKWMMANPDMPVGRKLWHLKALVEAKDSETIFQVLPGFLASVEKLIMLVSKVTGVHITIAPFNDKSDDEEYDEP